MSTRVHRTCLWNTRLLTTRSPDLRHRNTRLFACHLLHHSFCLTADAAPWRSAICCAVTSILRAINVICNAALPFCLPRGLPIMYGFNNNALKQATLAARVISPFFLAAAAPRTCVARSFLLFRGATTPSCILLALFCANNVWMIAYRASAARGSLLAIRYFSPPARLSPPFWM